jgi:hypothetical protein
LGWTLPTSWAISGRLISPTRSAIWSFDQFSESQSEIVVSVAFDGSDMVSLPSNFIFDI